MVYPPDLEAAIVFIQFVNLDKIDQIVNIAFLLSNKVMDQPVARWLPLPFSIYGAKDNRLDLDVAIVFIQFGNLYNLSSLTRC